MLSIPNSWAVRCLYSLDETNISAQKSSNELFDERTKIICQHCPQLAPITQIIAAYLQEVSFAYNPNVLTFFTTRHALQDRIKPATRNVSRHLSILGLPEPARYVTATSSKLALLNNLFLSYTIWNMGQKSQESWNLPTRATGYCLLFTFLNENTLLYVDLKHYAFIHQIEQNICNAVITPQTYAIYNENSNPPQIENAYLDPQKERLYLGFYQNKNYHWCSYSTRFFPGEQGTTFRIRATFNSSQLPCMNNQPVVSSSLSCNWDNAISILYKTGSSSYSKIGSIYMAFYQLKKYRGLSFFEDEVTLISYFDMVSSYSHGILNHNGMPSSYSHGVLSHNRLTLDKGRCVFNFGRSFVDHRNISCSLLSCDSESIETIVDELSKDSKFNVNARDSLGYTYLHTIVKKPYTGMDGPFPCYFYPDFHEDEYLKLQIRLYNAFVEAGANPALLNTWGENVFEAASPAMRKWLEENSQKTNKSVA